MKDAPPPYHHENPFNDGHTCDQRAHEVSISLGKRYAAVNAEFELQNNVARTARMKRFLRSRLARDYQITPARALDTADDPFFLLMMHYWYFTASEHHKVHYYCGACKSIYAKAGLWLHIQLGPLAVRPIGEISLFWTVFEFGKLCAAQEGGTTYDDSVIQYQAAKRDFASMVKKLQRDRNEAVAICGETLGQEVIDAIEKAADRYFSRIDGPNSFQLSDEAHQLEAAANDGKQERQPDFGCDSNLGWGPTRGFLCMTARRGC